MSTDEVDAPIIVSAVFAPADFAYFDGLRRAHFPPERNVIPAHLTLFHHLPPGVAREVKQRLVAETRQIPRPRAWISGLLNMGRGVAFRIDSTELETMRARLAEAFAPLLTPQDRAGWRPHVTVQNKVAPAAARALLDTLAADFAPRPVAIAGLASWWYRGGPWEPLSRHMFTP